MTSCAVKFCNSKMSQTKNISYFRFPSDPLRCKQWIEKCQTLNLLGKDPASLHRSYRVCGVHFEDNMFLNPTNKNRLTMNAVPTIFSAEILLEREKQKEMLDFEAEASCFSPLRAESSHSLSFI